MNKKVQLLVSQWCPTCPRAERMGEQVSKETGIPVEVLDVAQRPGRDIVANLMIRTIPATVIDGKLKFVGVPDLQAARSALQEMDTNSTTTS